MVTGTGPDDGPPVTGAPRPGTEPARAGAPTALEEELRRLAGAVPDPELPVVTLDELGVLRGVQVLGPDRVEVELTPTYTGCPAIESMSMDIERVLRAHGVAEVAVRKVLSPPWTTDDISDEGRRKLREAGIAPPRAQRSHGPVPVTLAPTRAGDGPAPALAPGQVPARGPEGTAQPQPGPRPGSHPGPRPQSQPGPGPGPGPDATPDGAPDASSAPSRAGDASAVAVRCPHCGSADTELLSRFSSTACKALRRCLDCREPFDHFKEV